MGLDETQHVAVRRLGVCSEENIRAGPQAQLGKATMSRPPVSRRPVYSPPPEQVGILDLPRLFRAVPVMHNNPRPHPSLKLLNSCVDSRKNSPLKPPYRAGSDKIHSMDCSISHRLACIIECMFAVGRCAMPTSGAPLC